MTRRCVFSISAIAAVLATATIAAATPQGSAGRPAPATGEPPAPAACGPGSGMRNVARDSRCFELRTYTVTGQVGDINLLHARFRQHSMRILQKHGMAIMGFWQQVGRPNTLTYLVAYRDAAARDAAWAEFQADPEWKEIASEMAVSLHVDSTYLLATDYGPVK